MNFRDKDGQTPMVYASNINQYEMVYMMMEAGGDPMIKDNYRYTILYNIYKGVINKKSDGYQWMLKVKEKLRERGIDVEAEWEKERVEGEIARQKRLVDIYWKFRKLEKEEEEKKKREEEERRKSGVGN